MNIELLNELESNGTLTRLFMSGMLSPKIKFYREVYLMVDRDMKINKSDKSVAVQKVADDLKISIPTVWRILGQFNTL